MSFQPDALKRELEKAIETLAKHKGLDLATKIKSILYANLDRKRLQRFMEKDLGSVNEYVNQVLEKYELFSSYIHQLQIERSNEAWEPLLKNMQKWAYRYLVRNGYSENKVTWENAQECASDAARSILKAYFPFDTDFEPWARVVVQNICLKFMRSSATSVPIVEESLEDLEGALQSLSSTTFSDEFHQGDEHDALFEAMSQLTDLRRQVLEMKYFHGLSPNEIAIQMGKTVRAVHSLQFHGLQDLRKIFAQIRNKFNE
jgi:RNA polymerase sigma factor (sigma-70 family)